MNKVSLGEVSNKYCPQPLFLYGTYKEDGSANFGLFCWFSYCWNGDLRVMACIGGDKLTKDRIHAGQVLSANLVSENILPLADYLGFTEGYSEGKMDIPINIGRGEVLDVPVLEDSPWSFELEIEQFLPMDGGEVFIAKIRNVLVDEAVKTGNAMTNPVLWMGEGHYYALNNTPLGYNGDFAANFK